MQFGGVGSSFGRGISPVGVWHHLVANYNRNKGGSKKVFLNGALIQQGSIGKKNPANNQPVKIGHWPGFLDDVRIYNRALSAAEVKTLYDFEKPYLRPRQSAKMSAHAAELEPLRVLLC